MKKKYFLLTCLITFVLSIIFLIVYYLIPQFNIEGFNRIITVNYEEVYKDSSINVCYGNIISCEETQMIKVGEVDTKRLGEYTIKYIYKYKNEQLVLYQKVYVVDNEKPVLDIESDYALVCPSGKIYDLKVTANDNHDKDLSSRIDKTYKDGKVYLSVKDLSGNIRNEVVDAKIEDNEAPTLTLNGKDVIYLKIGDVYTEEGAVAIDNCDDINVTINGEVNTNEPGNYIITYKAVDSSNNESTIKRTVVVSKPIIGNRIVYLTFDDGPSEYTFKLLDILKKYNVKATFFVTGHGSDEAILREYQEGHSIALHTYSHDYSIYTNVDTFFDDLYKVQERVKNITGHTTYLMRFAGGSSNLVSVYYDGGSHIMSTLVNEVEKRGFKYFDWNVSSGDAGGAYTSDEVYYNVISSLKEDYSIVLQHDIKSFSVDAVERIIEYGLANGYRFEKLDYTSPTAHHGVNN